MASKFLPRASPKQEFKNGAWALFLFATWIPPIIFFNDNVAEITQVQGPSMYPYFNKDYDINLQKNLVLSWKWNAMGGLKRGMIVSFWSPNDPTTQAVKRIIALEGDQVQTKAPYPHPVVTVPMGHVWVEGDDASRTIDSNTYGPISKNLIQGKVTHVIWPLGEFGRVRWEGFKGKTKVTRGEGHGN